MSIAGYLMKEHAFINNYLDKVQMGVQMFYWGDRLPGLFFKRMVEFSDNFISLYHHVKEEEVLFPILFEKLSGRIDGEYQRFHEQHIQANECLSSIDKLSTELDQMDVRSSVEIYKLASMYISYLRSHMRQENQIYFPWIDRYFSKSIQEDILAEMRSEQEKLGKELLIKCKKGLSEMILMIEQKYNNRYQSVFGSLKNRNPGFGLI